MSTDKIYIIFSSKKSARKWREENNSKMLSRSYQLCHGYALIFFYVYQSSRLISHGHRATELASSVCSRAELSSWIFLGTWKSTWPRNGFFRYERRNKEIRLVDGNAYNDHDLQNCYRNYSYMFHKRIISQNVSILASSRGSLHRTSNFALFVNQKELTLGIHILSFTAILYTEY